MLTNKQLRRARIILAALMALSMLLGATAIPAAADGHLDPVPVTEVQRIWQETGSTPTPAAFPKPLIDGLNSYLNGYTARTGRTIDQISFQPGDLIWKQALVMTGTANPPPGLVAVSVKDGAGLYYAEIPVVANSEGRAAWVDQPLDLCGLFGAACPPNRAPGQPAQTTSSDANVTVQAPAAPQTTSTRAVFEQLKSAHSNHVALIAALDAHCNDQGFWDCEQMTAGSTTLNPGDVFWTTLMPAPARSAFNPERTSGATGVFSATQQFVATTNGRILRNR
jgi:hypothetical protein